MSRNPQRRNAVRNPEPVSIERVRAGARAARNGDKSAFDHIFDRCFDAMYALAWKLSGDHVVAERLIHALVCAMDALLADPEQPQSPADGGCQSVVPPHPDL
jgi:hypothetical protein